MATTGRGGLSTTARTGHSLSHDMQPESESRGHITAALRIEKYG